MQEQTPQIQPEFPATQTQVLSKKERRMLRREEKQREFEHARDAQKRKSFVRLATIALLVLVAGYGGYRFLFASPDGERIEANLLNSCVTHSGGMHIHPRLTIKANGEVLEIPSNLGVSPACMRPVHTHDSSGTIHVEFPRKHDFTLSDFFKVWGKELPSSFTMTVDGGANSEGGNLILKDGQQIELTYLSANE